jgi:hypothetical protein
VRRLKNFSRKHPVTAQPSLALTAPNTARTLPIETRARERARNSYIRGHEHMAGGRLLAGHELITKAPDPRTAVPCGLGGRRRASTAARNRRARRPTTGGPVDYADGGIGCREPGGSFMGEGAARLYGRGRSSSMSRTLPASSGHIERGHRFVALGHIGGSPGSIWGWVRPGIS